MFEKLLSIYYSNGIIGILSALRNRFTPKRAKCFRFCKKYLSNTAGLEIGGPSTIFSKNGILPVYSIIRQLDNVNFAHRTIWDGTIKEGTTFLFDRNRPRGKQYVLEAADMSRIPSGEYDFILSSHVIEHIANPLKAFCEWLRISKDDGIIVLVVPHKGATFDHLRPSTTLEHLVADFENEIQENDLTHLPEILALHDLKKDPEAGTFLEFKVRSEKNLENRCLHHHVFDTELVLQLLNHLNLQVHAIESVSPCHIIAVAQKPRVGAKAP